MQLDVVVTKEVTIAWNEIHVSIHVCDMTADYYFRYPIRLYNVR